MVLLLVKLSLNHRIPIIHYFVIGVEKSRSVLFLFPGPPVEVPAVPLINDLYPDIGSPLSIELGLNGIFFSKRLTA